MRTKFLLVALASVVSGCTPQQKTNFPAAPTEKPGSDGFFVKKFPDGSASVSRSQNVLDKSWSIDCRVDQMNDKRDCSITSKTGGPFIYYGNASNPQSVCILGHDFPGRTGQIRIDKGSPVSTDNEGCVRASSILPQMRTGKTFLSRWVKWPYDYSRDDSYDLDGLNKAMEVVAEIQNGKVQ